MRNEMYTHKHEIELLAVDVFGSKEKAQRWLSNQNLALGASPTSMLDTEVGREQVKRVLVAISHGGTV